MSGSTLLDRLSSGGVLGRGIGRGELWALRYPWCWPLDPALAPPASHAPQPPAVGEVLLVTVDTDESGGAVWSTGAARGGGGPDRGGGRKPLGAQAESSARKARGLALGALKVVGAEALHGTGPALNALLLRRQGRASATTTVLDGSSVGLSLVLAEASRLLDLPPDSDWAASVALDEKGALLPVDGIETKLHLLATAALGVRRVLLHPEDHARAASLSLPRALDLIPVRNLEEALTAVFGDVRARLRERWAHDPQRATRDARALFAAALRGHAALTTWRPVAEGCALLRECAALAAVDRERLDFAEAIARRHSGERHTLIPPPGTALRESLPRTLLAELHAHALQSATDHSDEAVRERLAAPCPVPGDPREHTAEDLKVLGAWGRCQAAVGAYREAATTLAQAVEGWHRLLAADQSTHALCEWLRVLPLIDPPDAAALDRIVDGPVAEAIADPRTSPTSKAYLVLAIARARVQLGQPERALEALRHLDGTLDLPETLIPSWRRWAARAEAGVGNLDRARAHRDALGQLTGAPARTQHSLARIDEALEQGHDANEILEEALEGDDAAELRRIRARCGGGDPARYVAEHARY